jgi:hypothetical protein
MIMTAEENQFLFYILLLNKTFTLAPIYSSLRHLETPLTIIHKSLPGERLREERLAEFKQ